DGGCDPACDAQMVLLDEDRVVEPGPVIRAAAAADRVLLERAEAGCRLARVEDRRAGAVDSVDEGARERGDPTETAEQVERGAFAREDRACRPTDLGDPLASLRDMIAVCEERVELHIRVEC